MATNSNCEGCSQKDGCAGDCPSMDNLDELLEKVKLEEQSKRIKYKIIVMSGKGGVGKSTVAANLAVSLSLAGKEVGLLDVDIHGPSIPKILNLQDTNVVSDGEKIVPAMIGDSLKVMSVGLVTEDRDNPIIWRGPLKYGIIKQFIGDVAWGDLDFLIIDCPPGTGDEPLSVIQLLGNIDGAVIVTTPQDVATYDVRKSINFCKQLEIRVLGVIENMSGFVCPCCGCKTDIFSSGGGEKMAKEMNVPVLGAIPIDPNISKSGDDGQPYVYHYAKTETAKAFEKAIKPILEMDNG